MISNTKFPLHLPGLKTGNNENAKIISVEVQNINTEIAYFVTEKESLQWVSSHSYGTNAYSSLSQIIKEFRDKYQISHVDRISVTGPGPVIGHQLVSHRLPWTIDQKEIMEQTNVPKVFLINDLEAAAYGLAGITNDDLHDIRVPEKNSVGNVALLAPGEGLGEAGLFFDGDFLRPFATEGGHSEFSPRTSVEVEFYQFLNKIYGIVTWEKVLSKEGLFNIFRFLRDVKRHPQSEKLLNRLHTEQDFCKAVYDAAVEDNEQICTITINTYLEFLAREANSLVLKLKATGGLLIGGDLPILFKEYIDNDRFYNKFLISDKMENLLHSIPIYMITNDKMILNGAAFYAAFSRGDS